MPQILASRLLKLIAGKNKKNFYRNLVQPCVVGAFLVDNTLKKGIFRILLFIF